MQEAVDLLKYAMSVEGAQLFKLLLFITLAGLVASLYCNYRLGKAYISVLKDSGASRHDLVNVIESLEAALVQEMTNQGDRIKILVHEANKLTNQSNGQ